MEYQVRTNTRAGWQEIWRSFPDISSLPDDERFIFYVRLNSDSDVSNLRYFFPLYSFLKRKNIPSRLHLSGPDEMLRRASQFLSILVNSGDVQVAFGDVARTQREMICNAYLARDRGLTPEEAETAFCTLAGMTEQINAKGGYTYSFTYPKNRAFRKNGAYLINTNLLKQILCAIPETKPEHKNQIHFDVHFQHRLNASDLLPLIALSQDPAQYVPLLNQLSDLYREDSLNQLHKYDPEKKDAQKQQADKGQKAPAKDNTSADQAPTHLEAQYQGSIPSFEGTALAELIFYFMLRDLCNSGRAVISAQGKPQLNATLVQKIALDAKSYAEGLWQAIENAHLHSFGRVAYFGMRIYRSDPGSSMFSLFKESNTRHILWKSYWLPQTATQKSGSKINSNDQNNIFNLRTPDGGRVFSDFIEFYVLDDAIGEDGIPQGILEKIRTDQDSLVQSRSLSNISEVFKLSEADYKGNILSFYIKHYGMRWLRMHADRLNAIVQVYTPHLAETLNYQGKQYVRQRDLGGFCYSNIFLDGVLLSGTQKLSEGCLVWDKSTNTIETVASIPKEDQKNDTKTAPKDKVSQETITLAGGRTAKQEQLELLFPLPDCYSTEYSILIPLAYGAVPKSGGLPGGKPFSFGGDPDFYRRAEVRLIQPYFETDQLWADKIEGIRALERQLTQTMAANRDALPLYLFALDSCTSMQIEILAKALFSYIYRSYRSYRSAADRRRPLLIALYFGKSKDLIREFVRIFTIFYIKQGTNPYMEQVQIALCSRSRNSSRDEVNFILAGPTLRSAYHTANSFVYQNADSSLEFVPLLDYLTPSDSRESDVPMRICPFDLLLSGPDGRCWFLEQMKDKLDTDQRTDQYGCKLSNVHVRLGSKIHIDHFYEAELLFHNIGNINRFAYLIAGDIAQDIPGDIEHVVLVGYENYSSVLLQTVARLLEDHGCKAKISWVIDSHTSGKFPCVSFEHFSRAELDSWPAGSMCCYTVIPIGSTMSTVHKLLNSFQRGLAAAFAPQSPPSVKARKNYAIVAVGDCFKPGQPLSDGDFAKLYLSSVEQPDGASRFWQIATLQSYDSTDTAAPLQVHYCLWAETQWHPSTPFNVKNSIACSATQPLIQVDKTSTLLNAIFQTPPPKDVTDYYLRKIPLISATGEQKKNTHRTTDTLLRPNGSSHFIRYGHIVQGDNHYQFYFDFDALSNDPWIQKELSLWADNIQVDPDAYNIVISPLQTSNAVFLKTILGHVFGSNLHLLHIDINGTGKETIRTKFEYISEELKRIASAYSTVDFYYVDDSICTGITIQRAYKFLLMLCQQAGIGLSRLLGGCEGFKFKKVFLFINRNSYETAQTWVEHPTEDWLGFINLRIPSYNTHANTCPACQVRDRFQLLSKRSATNDLTKYFSRNAQKHKIRTPEEHDQYLAREIADNPTYLDWLRVYICSHRSVDASVLSADDYKELKKKFPTFSAQSAYQTMRQLFPLGTEPAYHLMRYIIDQEYYLRLSSMNQAYKTLVYNPKLQEIYLNCTAGKDADPKAPNFSAYRTALMQAVLGLLVNPLSSQKNEYERVITFSSYLKVISRDYIVRNYFIREAIYVVLHCILILLTLPLSQVKDQDDFTNYFKPKNDQQACAEYDFYQIICNKNYASSFYVIWDHLNRVSRTKALRTYFLYRILKITVHRLALLHSRTIICPEVTDRVLNAYQLLLENTKPEDRNCLPSLAEWSKTYIASIKTATMAEDDDGMCYNLLSLQGSENRDQAAK